MSSEDRSAISIAELATKASVGVFHVKAEMSLSNDLQQFCVLECSCCRQKKRTKDIREFNCPKCQKKTTLVTRCTFQIDLIDGSGTTTALVSGDLAEKLLCIKDAQDMLLDKVFLIQLRKAAWRSSNMAQSSLTVVSYMELESKSPLGVDERHNKWAKSIGEHVVDIEGTKLKVKVQRLLRPLNDLHQPTKCKRKYKAYFGFLGAYKERNYCLLEGLK